MSTDQVRKAGRTISAADAKAARANLSTVEAEMDALLAEYPPDYGRRK